ncbi:hypothetical protein B6U74_03690 [Candidatus Bathyarchaeota archaeon ex4484_205]|nr:MAG: hypothetical protein B6U74_03690 [Candidatus Bathyarchaeota archaeon ex4484_205]
MDAIRSHHLILMICDCRVEYEGRASSKLMWGRRIVLMKGDGSVVIHRPVGVEAVNWQPPPTVIHISSEDGYLKIVVVRRRPKEVLRIYIRSIDTLYTGKVRDSGEFYMYFDEEDLKKAILAHPELIEENFRIIRDEMEVEGGRVDLVGEDENGMKTLVELKKVGNMEAARQLLRYVSPIRRDGGKVRGILVAEKFNSGVKKFLKINGLEWREVRRHQVLSIIRKSRKLRRFMEGFKVE